MLEFRLILYFLLINVPKLILSLKFVILRQNDLNLTFNSSCDVLNSNKISNHIKCLYICQAIQCNFLSFNKTNRMCNLFYGEPSLIKNFSANGIKFDYTLSNKNKERLKFFKIFIKQ